jgi:hypothetical protein
MSENDKPTVVEALSAVMEDVQAIGKNDRNTQQGYQFRGIDATVNAVGPAFRKHGVIAVPTQVEARYRDVRTSTDKPSRECTVLVTYRIYGPAGDHIDAQVPGESMDFGDKGAPKAMSVAYRILLLQALCIPTHDPEPDAQSYERAAVVNEQEDAAREIEREATFEIFVEKIKAATSQGDINVVRERVKAALKEGRITRRQHDELGRRAVARVRELEAAAS